APSALSTLPAPHPPLRARVPAADTGNTISTGRLAAGQHPWLVEHALGDRALLPGTAMVELLLHVGRECKPPQTADLTLGTPVEVPSDENQDGTRLQDVVDAQEKGGARNDRVRSQSLCV